MTLIEQLRAVLALLAVRAQARLVRLLATIESRTSVHCSLPLTASHVVEPDGTVTLVPAEWLQPKAQA
jgi:hypothetical protein